MTAIEADPLQDNSLLRNVYFGNDNDGKKYIWISDNARDKSTEMTWWALQGQLCKIGLKYKFEEKTNVFIFQFMHFQITDYLTLQSYFQLKSSSNRSQKSFSKA